MDFLTLVGYFIAALAIAYGLYLILRKNVVKDDDTEQVDGETSDQDIELNPEGIELYNDNESRIPVVPRHIRDQLTAALPGSNQTVGAAGSQKLDSQAASIESEDESLLAQTAHINPASSRQLLEDDAEAIIAASKSSAPSQNENNLTINKTNNHLNGFNLNYADVDDADVDDTNSDDLVFDSERLDRHDSAGQSNDVLIQQGSHLVDSSRPDQEPAEDMFDQALAQLEAATAPELIEQASKNHDQIDMANQQTGELTENTASPMAQVEEWQGESALLEAHIEDQERRDDESALAQAEHIIALYVMPAASRTLAGERTMQLLRKFGLRYGEMSLFHRFLDSEGTGPLMFSVLRYTSEGPLGFDLEALPNEQIEGLAFFLALPSKHAAAGYDTMVSISTLLAREIQGQVYDEHMNELSPQLREHYRHFVLEYRTPD